MAAHTPLTPPWRDVSLGTPFCERTVPSRRARRIEGSLVGAGQRSPRAKLYKHRDNGKTSSFPVSREPRTPNERPLVGRVVRTCSPRSEMPPLPQKVERATTISLALGVRVKRASASDRANRGREFTSRRACDGHSTSTDLRTNCLERKHFVALIGFERGA